MWPIRLVFCAVLFSSALYNVASFDVVLRKSHGTNVREHLDLSPGIDKRSDRSHEDFDHAFNSQEMIDTSATSRRLLDDVHVAVVSQDHPLTASSAPKQARSKSSLNAEHTKADQIADEAEEEEAEEEEEGEEMSKFAVLTAVECIVIVLIMMTIGFEEMKEHVEEHSSRDLHPIVDSLFGEMTILGFLSAFTFVLTKIGLFEHLSAWLFGEEERGFLIEAFELVHFTLFFIMVCFVMQALCLMKDASDAEEEWLKLDAACQNEDFRILHEKKLLEKRKKTGKLKKKQLSTTRTVSSMSSRPSFLKLVSLGESSRKGESVSLKSSEIVTRTGSYGALSQLSKDSRPSLIAHSGGSSFSSGQCNKALRDKDGAINNADSSSIEGGEDNLNHDGEESCIGDALDELKIFGALREEFILDRSLHPPFLPQPVEQRLPSDFNFGRYLSMCLGKTIAKVVHVNIETWYSVIIFSLGFYFIGLFVNLTVLSVIWTLLGYLALVFNIYFEVYLMQLRDVFIPRNILEPLAVDATDKNCLSRTTSSGTKKTSRTSYSTNGEDDESISSEDDEEIQQMLCNLQKKGYLTTTQAQDPSTLPQWCSFDVKDLAKRRGTVFLSLTASLLAEDPTKANRQEKHFWGGKKGLKVHTIALQLNLVFTGVYCAFQIIVFLPVIWSQCIHWSMFLLYLIMSIWPVVGLVYNKATLVSTLSLVGSIGCHRAHQITAGVLREEKTARAVRSIVVIFSLYNAVNKERENMNCYNDDDDESIDLNNTLHEHELSLPSKREKKAHRRPLSHFALLQLSNIFDTFDKNEDGVLSHDELQNVLTSLPGEVSHDQVDLVIATLDSDRSGDVSREEFLRWCVERMAEDFCDKTSEKLAHALFHMFDHDGSGEITIGEFKATLDSFHLNFTLEEVGDIVRQLDENGDGMIGVDEFEEMLERFKINLFEDDDDDIRPSDHQEGTNNDNRNGSNSTFAAEDEVDEIMIISSMHSRNGSSFSLGPTADDEVDCSYRSKHVTIDEIVEVPAEEDLIDEDPVGLLV